MNRAKTTAPASAVNSHARTLHHNRTKLPPAVSHGLDPLPH